MFKLYHRFVGLLLVACLIVNPALADGLGSIRAFAGTTPPSSIYSEQALAARLGSETRANLETAHGFFCQLGAERIRSAYPAWNRAVEPLQWIGAGMLMLIGAMHGLMALAITLPNSLFIEINTKPGWSFLERHSSVPPLPPSDTNISLAAHIKALHDLSEFGLVHTPLTPIPPPVADFAKDMRIWVKNEGLQVTGSFKPHILAQFVQQLDTREKRLEFAKKYKVITTATTGNQGQALAWAVKRLKELYPEELGELECRIFVAEDTPLKKTKGMTDNGAEVIPVNGLYPVAEEMARSLAKEDSVYYMAHGGEAAINSYGSLGIEIVEDLVDAWKARQLIPADFDVQTFLELKVREKESALEENDAPRLREMETQLEPLAHVAALVPVGVGGLISGVASALKALHPNITIISVESDRTNTMFKSLKAGEVVSHGLTNGFMNEDGVKASVEQSAFEVVYGLADGAVTVPNTLIDDAIFRLAQSDIRAEGASAMPEAALKNMELMLYLQRRGVKDVVLVVTGSNIDDERWNGIVYPRVAREQNREVLDNIARLILLYVDVAILWANDKTDNAWYELRKVGAHAAACASSLHIILALLLFAARGGDLLALKPHAGPVYHAIQVLQKRLSKGTLFFLRNTKFKKPATSAYVREAVAHNPALKEKIDLLWAEMLGEMPRSFVPNYEDGLGAYLTLSDPDRVDFPLGPVGLPAGVTCFEAIVSKLLQDHGIDAPTPHIFAVLGDGETHEEGLGEALRQTTQHQVRSVTHIIDFNRQTLSGAPGDRRRERQFIEDMYKTAGWEVIHIRWGSRLNEAFALGKDGQAFQRVMDGLSDPAYQKLTGQEGAQIRKVLIAEDPSIEKFLYTHWPHDKEFKKLFLDLAGHDMTQLTEAMDYARNRSEKPVVIIAQTLKGWGMERLIGHPLNHSEPLTDADVQAVQSQLAIPDDRLAHTENEKLPDLRPESPEARFIAGATARFENEETAYFEHVEKGLENLDEDYKTAVAANGGIFPDRLGLDKLEAHRHDGLPLQRMMSTQGFYGEALAYLKGLQNKDPKDLTPAQRCLRLLPIHSNSPDVGPTTNMLGAMDGQIYGPEMELNPEERIEKPDFRPHPRGTHTEGPIAEFTMMTFAAALGATQRFFGVLRLPWFHIYDVFIPWVLGPLIYAAYGHFPVFLFGTPSGITLASEGGAHEVTTTPVDIMTRPNTIGYEPWTVDEAEYILVEELRRYITHQDKGRQIRYFRGTTLDADRHELWKRLRVTRDYARMAQGLSPAEAEKRIRPSFRDDVLKGGYRLVDYRDYPGYDPERNVIDLVVVGAMVPEALAASDALLRVGIFADVTVVTSPKLLVGSLGEEDDYAHLRKLLRDRSDRKHVPIVTIADAPKEYLTAIGGILGTEVRTLGVKDFAQSKRSVIVNYAEHGLDHMTIAREAQAMISRRLGGKEVDLSELNWQRVYGEAESRGDTDLQKRLVSKIALWWEMPFWLPILDSVETALSYGFNIQEWADLTREKQKKPTSNTGSKRPLTTAAVSISYLIMCQTI